MVAYVLELALPIVAVRPRTAFEAAVDAVVGADPVSPRPITCEAVATLLRGAFGGAPPRPTA